MADTADPTSPSAVPGDVFRDVIGHFASGVTVITTEQGEKVFGTTASAVSSLSAEPPMILVCLNQSSTTGAAIAESRAFAVNILAEDQERLARRFASKDPNKFDPEAVSIAVDEATSLPYLSDALAVLTARVVETVQGGTHTVFLGIVENARSRAGTPLAYYRGQFGRLEMSATEAARKELRDRILDARLQPGTLLDIGALAKELSLAPMAVDVAVNVLAADGLLESLDEGFSVIRVSADALSDSMRARASIELGVISRLLSNGALDDAVAALRRQHANWMPVSPSINWSDRHEYGTNFHESLVSLAGEPALVEAYRQLGVPSALARAFRGYALSERDESYGLEHETLIDAIEARDAEKARSIIVAHSERIIAEGLELLKG